MPVVRRQCGRLGVTPALPAWGNAEPSSVVLVGPVDTAADHRPQPFGPYSQQSPHELPDRLRQGDQKARSPEPLCHFAECTVGTEVDDVVSRCIEVHRTIWLEGSVRQLLVPGSPGSELVAEPGSRAERPRPGVCSTIRAPSPGFRSVLPRRWPWHRLRAGRSGATGWGWRENTVLHHSNCGRVDRRKVDHRHGDLSSLVQQFGPGGFEEAPARELRRTVRRLEGNSDEGERGTDVDDGSSVTGPIRSSASLGTPHLARKM